jgi:single-stranded DNA-binding protein
MNLIFVVGNITSDIYFDHLLISGKQRPFLRLVLMSSRPRPLRGMRIVLWDEKAELFFPYLQTGSEIAVIGPLQTRQFKDKLVHEIEAINLILLRKIQWEAGEQERTKRGLPQPTVSANNVFVVGTISEDIYFDRFNRKNGGGSYAFLRLMLSNDQYLEGLRVSVLGTLAELAYPYLQNGSKIAVDGHLQTRDRETGKKVVEVVAEHIAFLENINWAGGEAAQKPRLEQAAQEVPE